MNLQEILLASTPIVIGLVAVFQKIGMPSSWSPLAALILGTGTVALFAHGFNTQVILFGIISGLSSVGLYAGTTSTKQSVSALFKPKIPTV